MEKLKKKGRKHWEWTKTETEKLEFDLDHLPDVVFREMVLEVIGGLEVSILGRTIFVEHGPSVSLQGLSSKDFKYHWPLSQLVKEHLDETDSIEIESIKDTLDEIEKCSELIKKWLESNKDGSI